AHLPGGGGGRRTRAAGGTAVRRGRAGAVDRGLPRGRELLRQLPAAAGRTAALGRGGLPGADLRGRRRRAAQDRRPGARTDHRGDGGPRRAPCGRCRSRPAGPRMMEEPAMLARGDAGDTRRAAAPAVQQRRGPADGWADSPGAPLAAPDYRPPRWLRNPHLQSILGSSPLRRRRGLRAMRASGAVNTVHVVDGGDGVRLQGVYSQVPGTPPRALALLLHGWEGSAESSYMQLTAARLLARGFATFRLNFRDHGGTHHLNEALFHSNLIGEVVHAAGDIARRFRGEDIPLVAAGYSLGGNFA